MIDIHSHILPGVDDGAMDMYDTLELLEMAVDSGVTEIVATPHCNIPGYFENYFGQWYVDTLRKVREVTEMERIPIKVLPGMEVYATEEVPKLLSQGKIMSINGSRYVLIEFEFNEDPDFTFDILQRVKEVDAYPVIAHVERYRFVQEYPQIVYEWRKMGCLAQVNKGSFQGGFGRRAQDTAYRMMNHNLVSVIASDGHSPQQRTTYMREVWNQLERDYPRRMLEVLFRENPWRICNNETTIRFPWIPFGERENI